MAQYKPGDIFALPLPNQTYLSGRILLDVQAQCATPRLITTASPLDFFRGYLLIEMFEHISDEPTYKPSNTLLSGLFINSRALKSGKWPIIASSEVDPTQIEFPEIIYFINNRLNLVRGEVALPIQKNSDYFEGLGINSGALSPPILTNTCLYFLNLKHLLPEGKTESYNLKRGDLRFSEHRPEVYEVVDADENESYYELSKRLGHDVTRFF